jgi:hypothetical protein
VPSSNSNAPITYRSETPSVATVATDSNNVTRVTITGKGEAWIVAEQAATQIYAAGSTRAKLTVNAAVTNLTWSAQSMRLGGGTLTLSPPTSTNPGGVFTYSLPANNGIATVANNVVTALRAGTTQITATQAATGNYQGATIQVNLVVDPSGDPLLGMGAMTRKVGDGAFTPITTTAAQGARQTFSIREPNSSVASVAGNKIVPSSPGTVTVIVTQDPIGFYNGATAEATLTVSAAQAAQPTTLSIEVGPKVYGNGTFTPTVRTNSNGQKTFSSSTTTVATVNPDTGVVEIKGAGRTTLTVSVGVDATAGLSAATASTELVVEKSSAQLSVGDVVRKLADGAFPLTVNSLSAGAVQVAVDPTTPGVVDVTNPGAGWTVTPRTAGTAKLNITQATDANHLAASITATITVTENSKATISWAPPKEWTRSATGTNSFALPQPSSNSGGVFTYTSSNTNVATVSGSTVTIVGVGTTTLSAVQGASGAFVQTTITSDLVVSDAPVTQPMEEGVTPLYTSTIVRRYGDAPFQIKSMPGFSSNITPGDPNAQWQVSYSSGNPSVLSVIGDVATIRQIGVATITATWTSASLGRTQNVLHPFSIIKGDPATRPNFSSPLTLPFGTDPITPSIFTRSDAPIQLVSQNTRVATVSNDGKSIQPVAADSVRIDVKQVETAFYEAYSGSFDLNLQLGSPGLSQFPDQTYTFNPLSPSISMVKPLSSSPGTFDYTSSNPNVGTVEAGTFAMKGVGSTVITATQRQSGPYGSASIQATYTVQAADSQLRFTTTGVSTVLIGRPFSLKTASNSPGDITYTSSNAAVDTVRTDQYTVQVTPQSAGDVNVIASQAGSPEYQGKLVTMPIQVRIDPELSLATFLTVTNAPAFQPPWSTKSNGAITVALTPQTGINVASLSGNTITPTGVGTVLVTVTQGATTTYGGATVSALMTVGAKTPTITGLGTGYSLVYPAVSSFT